jgi:type I restriction enzyme M protein
MSDNNHNKEQLAADVMRACDIMRRDNNCGGVMEYVEHLAWLLFLKFLEDQEAAFEAEAAIAGSSYTRVLDGDYRWSSWVPRAIGAKTGGRRGTPEWDGTEFMQFIRGRLIPHLASLAGDEERDLIAAIFNDRNVVVCASPFNLKDVVEIIDGISFTNSDDVQTVGYVYESLLRRLGNENQIAGEFYTPRPVIRFLVQVINPQIGETVYDPAVGSAGFLSEAFVHMREGDLSTEDERQLQRETFVGQEKKPVPALLGLINMVLHGALVPDVRRRNTLEENIRNVSERFDVVLTNPPFGGTENQQIQSNFPVQSNATELLFIQHIMRKLRAIDGARCGMVVPEGTLCRTDTAFASVKQELLAAFELFMVVSLPQGTFAPYSDVKTGLLLFRRPGPTREVLYHEVTLPEGVKKFSKGVPIADSAFDDARDVARAWLDYLDEKGLRPAPTPTTWIEAVETFEERGWDLRPRNPSRGAAGVGSSSVEITASLLERTREIASIVERLHFAASAAVSPNGDGDPDAGI